LSTKYEKFEKEVSAGMLGEYVARLADKKISLMDRKVLTTQILEYAASLKLDEKIKFLEILRRGW
jgi:hypothetical protein